ncbi:CheR family methyltransferase [Hydrogenophaga pseudoflava]|uniref:CheR family methyltransferase n=1 Tax=Hydrogenophaga pseudoflava TaxID=47421 RepID=UPI0027E4D6C9|nr:protein-glutamate O-methyltransferase CheR [Hydrogenophaga pseudoflava]MDQ7746100.1 protein-glutamate O-methyltransferase CheR [Hydrogenophaga pseudoflava]
MTPLHDDTYRRIAGLMHEICGLSFADSKKPLVSSRLSPRIQRLGMGGFEDYLDLITSGHDQGELQVAIDLLTTNETYFFREPAHFDLLQQEVLATRPASLAVWSAASSFGDEAYSVAMLLADLQLRSQGPAQWSVLGTDISDRVLRSAAQAVYPRERLRQVSDERLRRYCLRGEGESEGLVQIKESLRRRVRFGQVNLFLPVEGIGPFDVVFLRNVLIYFDPPTKTAVVDRVLRLLRPGGLFFIGTAEGRVPCETPLQVLGPGAFRKGAVS